ncbi:MAG TPA: Kdo hydroxylase family protein [Vicinamibacterales bacterium]
MIRRLNHPNWGTRVSAAAINDCTAELEDGVVLLLPELAFDVRWDETVHFSPSIAAAKNVSFDPSTGRLGGAAVKNVQDRNAESTGSLTAMLRRFSEAAASLVDALFPAYSGRLQRARASFRPAEIAGRRTTWRHDDTRLHIDSFPATPVQGRRILRVFTNVNPEGRSRSWRIGEPFEEVAGLFGGQLRMPLPFSGALLKLAGITKSRRSAYDALMLQLHDRMKADLAYQRNVPQTAVDFPAGSTWIAFTDCVSHAAMAGQYQLEQTFLLPVDAMQRPERSPLRILERLKKRALV